MTKLCFNRIGGW